MTNDETYSVKISNVKAHNLTLKKETANANNIDPYVKFMFDNNKKIRTETLTKTTNAVYKFETSFQYKFKYGEPLETKMLTVEVLDQCLLGSDNYIGGFTMSYNSIIHGPVHNRVVIRNDGKPSGTIEFDLEMKQLTETLLTFKRVVANFYPGAISPMDQQAEKFLSYFVYDGAAPNSKDRRVIKTRKSPLLQWPDLEQLNVETSLKALLSNPIVFTIHNHRQYTEADPAYGQTTLKLESYVTRSAQLQDNQRIAFVEPIVVSNQIVGALEGEVYLTNAPLLGQMVAGTHTDVGIEGGQDLFSSLNGASSPTTQDAPLPTGWEKRTDDSGKVYYVDHNTKTSHWSLPAQAVHAPPPPPPVQPAPTQMPTPIQTQPSVPSAPSVPFTSQPPPPTTTQQPPMMPQQVQQQQQQQPPVPQPQRQMPQMPIQPQQPMYQQQPQQVRPPVGYPGVVPVSLSNSTIKRNTPWAAGC
ncbi:hypothetical protein SAMD00019534_034940 [Acytostelium subglobosum LB1]|uniref:hypothetical protein n=1 Tax=Acytostelium subglobosum LB1 TaxID=1410327 RepID=UPI00064522A4|nr:hypothetical protein SAMD00019534_034940 [Acytostelium subglobosum LB1]GAM20319.1 hypothetical protein SAMD00019534_034940 [Acytostelium subglobosum LB1]|eukprot:XP_012759840.1 hypothetical protein SAMD00019534_034940 [Acytostelium subglobosum LB1]